MKCYLVGGAVRDKLLNLPNNDKDFVVVGSNVATMLALGYQQIGKDFPVFLHPKTKDQYALARVEKKTGLGYTGFNYATKNITLKQDLSRRDLTINSMAMDEKGQVIDYFGGLEDLHAGILRHTSSAFVEDPVRILRLARFGVKFAKYGFKVAHSTHKLAKQMVLSGEVDSLVAERVFIELTKALTHQTPSIFFKTLTACGAFEKIFALPTINTFTFLDGLQIASYMKFAVWLAHYPLADIINTCHKIKAPKKYSELAKLTKTWSEFANNFSNQDQQQKLTFYLKTDALRRTKRFEDLLTVFQILKIKTTPIEKIWQQLKTLDINKLNQNNLMQEIMQARLKICKIP